MPDLGPRGEGWVALQFLAIAAVAGCDLAGPGWPEMVMTPSRIAGFVLAGAGLLLLGLGSATLGRSLTPLPRPLRQGELRRQGIYRLVRHPIYGGVVLIASGSSLVAAPLALAPTALLTIVLELKRRREEAWLLERYPAYASYKTSTPRRFLPWLV